MALPYIQIGDGTIGNALLTSVQITQELNNHWWCTVVCRNTEDQRVPVEDLLGQSVEVKTTDANGVQTVQFSGTVHDVELEYEIWGSYTATLTAVSNSYGMDVTAHKQYYADQTLSSVANTIAGRHSLSISVNASGSKALDYVQYGESDFSFLHRIVDDYGAWMRPNQQGLEVFNSFQAGDSLSWREEEGLVSFRLRGQRVNPSFSGSHYDHHVMESNTFQQLSKAPQLYDGGARLTSSVERASQVLPAGFEPQRARAMTLDNYSDQLQAESERALGSAVVGTGSSRKQTLKAGNTVTLDGTLDAKGTYGLTRVVHRWTTQGYSNEFVCTPWKSFRNASAPGARLWNGIVPARVVDHNDPKKMGRVKVQFFWQEDGSTHWARATAPHAGPDRGFMFMPEVGDEVAVAFEDGDPERPIILGSLWNGVQQAPRYDFRGGDIDPNNVKRLVTKSGNRIHLTDKPGEETVFLATPNHTSLSMTEKSDQTGRQLIHLHSDGDIVLSAPNGRVHIQSNIFSREIGPGAKAAGSQAKAATAKAGATGAGASGATAAAPSGSPGTTASGVGKTTTITHADGSKEVRHGSRPWRDNNPGDIEIPPKSKHPFAMSHGAIGKEGGVYAIFPDQQTGRTALHDLLKTDTYQQMSISDAMKRFAPASDGNDPAAYAKSLSGAVNAPVETPLSSLNDDQLSRLMDQIGKVEGFNSGGTVTNIPAPPH